MMKRLRTSKKFKIYRSMRRRLSRSYPEAFPARGRRPPLKIGIIDDLRSDGRINGAVTDCRVFLRIWTNSTAYLKSIEGGGERIGLRGIPEGRVERPHAAEAAKVLRQRKNKTSRLTLPQPRT